MRRIVMLLKVVAMVATDGMYAERRCLPESITAPAARLTQGQPSGRMNYRAGA
jgi:hypothetical protein